MGTLSKYEGFGPGTISDAGVLSGLSLRTNSALLLEQALVNISGDNITESSGAVTSMLNQGTGGADFDLDVVVGTGANLKKSISDAVLLYGASGDFVSTPDSGAASITGTIDLRGEATLDDWGSGTAQELVVKWTGVGDNKSYRAFISGTRNLQLGLSADGSTTTTAGTAPSGFVDGEVGLWRMTWDQSSKDVKYFTRSDGDISSNSGWTQVGTTQTLNIASIFDSTAVVEIGSVNAGTTNRANGSISRAQVYNGIDGTLAVDFNAADYVNKTSDTTFPSSATGEVWTLQGNSFIQNTGKAVVHSIGSAALETTLGQTINSGGTVFMVARQVASPSADEFFFDSRSTTDSRWVIFSDDSNSDKWTLFQGGVFVALTEANDSDPHVFTGQFNGDSSSKLTVGGVGSASGDSDSDNWEFGTLFGRFDAAGTAKGYIATLIVFDFALTEAQVTTMQDFLESTYSL